MVTSNAIEYSNSTTARVTILTRIDGRPAGKTFDEKGKHVAHHTGCYHARTVTLTGSTPTEVLTAYADLVGSLSVAQSLILGHAPALPTAYEIRPAKALPDDGSGIYFVDGRPTIARLKQHFTPSRLLLLDFDPDERMPESWHALDAQGRWDLLTSALPEFAGAARLTIPSGSARVLTADGRPVKSGPLGSHTYIVSDRDLSTADLDEARTALEVRLWAAGLGYTRPSKSGADLKRALFDSSVWTAGREVFDGPPCVKAPYRLTDLSSVIVDGGMVSIVTTPDDIALTAYEARTGARVVRQGDGKGTAANGPHGRIGAAVRLAIEDHTTLKLDTTVITEIGPITVRQFLESGRDKLRAQATFRESTSWAGILRRTKQGAVLIDVGTGTAYKLGSDPEELSGDLTADLATLAKALPTNAQATARALLWRHGWRCPIKLGFTDLVSKIVDAHPGIVRVDLEAIAGLIEHRARQRAAAAVTIDVAALPRNVTVHRAPDIDAVRAGIEAIGSGVHLAKSPHGTGKTKKLLKPVALKRNGVVAIAPRVSLVSALADPDEGLNLAHYQTPGAANDPDLAICCNSLIRPDFAQTLDAARAVLIDEIARITRDCHDASSTHGTKARAVWDRLTGMMRTADLAIGVDADLNTADVAMLAAAVGPVHVWIVDESQRDKYADFDLEEAILAVIDEALRLDEKLLIVADSANKVAGLADELAGRFPNKRILAVHDHHALSTKGTPEALALLAKINAEAVHYDVLLLSPTVESGVSLETEHFTRHFAIYTGTVEPSAFNQMLLRDRTAKRWKIAIAGHGKSNFPESFDAALNALHSSQRLTIDSDGERATYAPATAYDADCCRVMSAATAARNMYGPALWYLLEARGWTVERGDMARDVDGRELRRAAREAVAISANFAICTAPDKTAREIDALRTAYRVTPKESAAIARADVRDALGLPDGEITPEDVDIWNGGKITGQSRNFAALTAETNASRRDREQEDAGIPWALRSHDAARAKAVQALFNALGIDPETGTGTVTDATARAAYDALVGTAEAGALSHFGIAKFTKKPPAYPVRWAADALKRLGLYLELDKHAGTDGKDGRRYRLAMDAKRGTDGRVKLPGWTLMAEIRDRRAASRSPENDTSAHRTLTPASVIRTQTPSTLRAAA